jgi:hypothetical protein
VAEPLSGGAVNSERRTGFGARAVAVGERGRCVGSCCNESARATKVRLRRDDFRRHVQSAACLVGSDVVRYASEERWIGYTPLKEKGCR